MSDFNEYDDYEEGQESDTADTEPSNIETDDNFLEETSDPSIAEETQEEFYSENDCEEIAQTDSLDGDLMEESQEEYFREENSDENIREESQDEMIQEESTEEESRRASGKEEQKESESSDEGQMESSQNRERYETETGWSKDITDCIEDDEQYEIYKNAELSQGEINGRICLMKEIDPDYVGLDTDMTNRERMEKGLSPYDSKTGEKIELHHMGQRYDSPFAELCQESEHGDGNHRILHRSMEDSWRREPGRIADYNNEKKHYWMTRGMEGLDK